MLSLISKKWMWESYATVSRYVNHLKAHHVCDKLDLWCDGFGSVALVHSQKKLQIFISTNHKMDVPVCRSATRIDSVEFW